MMSAWMNYDPYDGDEPEAIDPETASLWACVLAEESGYCNGCELHDACELEFHAVIDFDAVDALTRSKTFAEVAA